MAYPLSETRHALLKTWTLLLSPLFLLCIGLAGCGSSASLSVIKPLSDTSQYHSVTVVGEGNGVAAARAGRRLKELLVDRLSRKGVMGRVGSDGDLILRLIVQNVDEGREVKRALSLSGRARATVEVKITEPNGRLLAHLNVESTSERKGDQDTPLERVLTQIADRITSYLESHATPKKKT